MKLVKRAIKSCMRRMGYQILAAPKWEMTRNVIEQDGYNLVDWRRQDGRYDLTAYRSAQEKGNQAKIDQIWTNEENLRFISQWLKDRGLVAGFIVCHGTRNGFEQRVFQECFGCEVVGTEIAPSASQFAMTIQADFHEPQLGWAQRADIVYSNSLDHAYDPAKALRTWAATVKDKGVIVLEKASDSDPRGVSDLDPFGIGLPNLLVFILTTLGDSACIRALVDAPKRRDGAAYHKMIVIEIDRGARFGD